MDRDTEKKIVKAMEKEIIAFIKEWRRAPFMWNRESDIQVEIASRLKSVLQKAGKLTKKANFKINLQGYKGKPQKYSSICCEEVTYYRSKGKIKWYYPDIVVFDDLCEPYSKNNLPGDVDKKGSWPQVNWPMLLVCEIKYESESYGDFHKENRTADIAKLNRLLKQNGDPKINGTKYAFFLNFERKKETRKGDAPNTAVKKGKVIEFGFKRGKRNPLVILPSLVRIKSKVALSVPS